jgi:hypothetical protein
MQRGEDQGVDRQTKTHSQAPMLLKTPSLSPVVLCSLRYRMPVLVGQDPVRSRKPLASLENTQSPKLQGRIDPLPDPAHSTPWALLGKKLTHRAKSASAAVWPLLAGSGSPLSCLFCLFSRFRAFRPLLLRPRFFVAPVTRRARGATPPPEQLPLSATASIIGLHSSNAACHSSQYAAAPGDSDMWRWEQAATTCFLIRPEVVFGRLHEHAAPATAPARPCVPIYSSRFSLPRTGSGLNRFTLSFPLVTDCLDTSLPGLDGASTSDSEGLLRGTFEALSAARTEHF